MSRNDLSASEIARRIWGTTKDRRGYDVARNRDRIGHYLSGNSYPEPDNLAKLAEALGVAIEDIAMPEGDNPGPRSRAGAHSAAAGGIHLIPVPDDPGKMRLQIDRIVDLRRVPAIIRLLIEMPEAADDTTVVVEHSRLGTIVNGNHNQ